MNQHSNSTEEQGNPVHIAKVHKIIALQDSVMSQIPDVRRGLAKGSFKGHESWIRWRQTLKEPLNLSGADFSGLRFREFDFDNAKMVGVNFHGAVFFLCSFKNADLRRANFTNAEAIVGFWLDGANVAGADFSNAQLACPGADERTDFTGTNFSRCRIKKYTGGSGGEEVRKFRGLLSREQQKQLAGGWFWASIASGIRRKVFGLSLPEKKQCYREMKEFVDACIPDPDNPRSGIDARMRATFQAVEKWGISVKRAYRIFSEGQEQRWN